MTAADTTLLADLRHIVGKRHVLTGSAATLRFRRGYRGAAGQALAVVRPGTLVEQWRVLTACVAADVIVITQAANTGLTGGSTPQGDYDRPVVIVSTMRLTGLYLLDGAQRALCLPGVTLHQLERALRPLGREPHSVIGSSCFGASVIGGVCNNSGGSLVRRGPAYTEAALYARLGDDGTIALIDTIGLGEGDALPVLARLDAGQVPGDAGAQAVARSDPDYARHVRDVAAATPARYNADPRRLRGASGSAGRVMVFAVAVDTFAKESATTTFYIGSNDPAVLTRLRRAMLDSDLPLPIAAEYLHRTTFATAARYGRDTAFAIRRLGTDRLPGLFAAKARIDSAFGRLGVRDASERMMQAAAPLLPGAVPARIGAWHERYEHHLLLKVSEEDAEATRALLDRLAGDGDAGSFTCTPTEAEAAFLLRFVAAGAAVRRQAVDRAVGGIVALDVALPRNATEWLPAVPAPVRDDVLAEMHYGHFFCHVFHRDYLIRRGGDAMRVKRALLAALDAEGAEYPAEHNVGHSYVAKPALANFYRSLDPRNRLNPGIGATSRASRWGEQV